MPRTSIRVTGVGKVIGNLTLLQSQIKSTIGTGLKNAAYALRDQSIKNLEESINPNWGHGVEVSQSISRPELWVPTEIDWKSLTLECRSNHAAVVEFGGFHGQGGAGTVTTLVQGGPYEIGRSQGMAGIWATSFRIQRGYSYTTRAMNNPNTMNAMLNEVGKILKRTIAIAGV